MPCGSGSYVDALIITAGARTFRFAKPERLFRLPPQLIATIVRQPHVSVHSLDLGPEYPEALQTPGGERLPLLRERRWSREFGTPHAITTISRFMDGSATITVEWLAADWPNWSRSERLDFMQNCTWLKDRADFSHMIRFLIRNADTLECSTIAQSIAMALPSEEAFTVLQSLLRAAAPGGRANFLQAITLMRHPRSLELVQEQLDVLRTTRGFWDDDTFVNWIAYDATCAVEDILRLGGDPKELEPLVRQLAAHPCKGNVDSARRRLAQHYSDVFPGGAA